MRIGYVLSNFPPLSETFIRREVLALCDLGHEVYVFAHRVEIDPRVGSPIHPGLRVRHLPFLSDIGLLSRAAMDEGIEHFHGSLMIHPQLAAWQAARVARIPFSITAYGGHTVFASEDRTLYRDLSRDDLCGGVVVEDPFMLDWVVAELGADRDKTVVIGNSLDLAVYRPEPRVEDAGRRILAIGRFVEKKGLVHVIDGFLSTEASRQGWELLLVGGGIEEPRLRAAAAGHPGVQFCGYFTEEQCRQAYRYCEIFALPCVRARDGDADGIATTVLEAMAMQRPVVTSDLLGAKHYVRDGVEGLLTLPGDGASVGRALDRLCADADERRVMGERGRARVEEICDIRRNTRRLDEMFRSARRRRWGRVIDLLEERRRGSSAETLARTDEDDRRAVEFFRPFGRVLEIGCGDGTLRAILPDGCRYLGCDPITPEDASFPFVAAFGEALPFATGSFDGVVLSSTLSYALDTGSVLEEAARVLRPGGRLHLQERVDDLNDAHAHLNHISGDALRARVSARFEVGEWRRDGDGRVLAIAVKPAPLGNPLVSVVITTYDRASYVVRAVESVLRQTHRPVEVVVVDDGSTDGTVEALDRFRTRIRLIRHAENRGIAAAKNAGLRATSPEARYVAILDSDDFYTPEFVERCVALLEERPEVGLVYTDDVHTDAFGRELGYGRSIEPWSTDEWLRTRNLRGDTWVARRDLVFETELHDETLPLDVDYDLFYQLLELTEFAHLPEPLGRITVHPGRITKNEVDVARCHAANLVKYGFSPEYAYLRARGNPEWIPAIEDGVRWGRELREQREERLREGEKKLALEGGRPVRRKPLPAADGSRAAGAESPGEAVDRLERKVAEAVGAEHAVAVASTGAAVLLSLRLDGIGPGDEVVVSPLADPGIRAAVELAGASLVFADVCPATLNLDPNAVDAVLTGRTRAILVSCFAGLPADPGPLREIAGERGIAIVRDATEALSARAAGAPLGADGGLSILSVGEGAVLTTGSAEEAGRLREWARSSLALSDLVAAAARPGLEDERKRRLRREEVAGRYDSAFAGLPVRLQARPDPAGGDRHGHRRYVVRLNEDRWRAPREDVVRALEAERIGAATVHAATGEGLPNARRAGRTMLALPIYAKMTDRDAEDVVRALTKVAAVYAR